MDDTNNNKNQKNRPKANRPRVAKPKTRKPGRAYVAPDQSAVKEFLHCAAGGGSSSNGFPDGDSRLSITRDVRANYTLKPDASGNLGFILAAGASAFVQTLVTTGNPAVGQALSGATATGFAAAVPANAGIIPHEFLGVGTTVGQDIYTHWRVLRFAASVRYSGSTMNDGGNVAASPYTRTSVVAPIPTSTGDVSILSNVVGIPLQINSGSHVGAAKRDFTFTSFPMDTEYQTLWGSQITTTQRSMQDNSSHRACYVKYVGLDPNASVTIDIHCCIQAVISQDSSSVLNSAGRPSPLGDRSLLNRAVGYLTQHTGVREVAGRAAATAGNLLVSGVSNYLFGPAAGMLTTGYSSGPRIAMLGNHY